MYTPKEYSQMAIQANEQGKRLYVLVNEETNDETLVIAPNNYYVTIEPDTNRTYGKVNKQFESEQLKLAKDSLKQEALIKAKTAIGEGTIQLADGIEIETDNTTIIDLNTALTVMKDKGLETYFWIDKNDNAVELTETDINDIIINIGVKKNFIWNTYFNILTKIDKAKTVDEVKAIKVSYTQEVEETDEEVEDDDFEEFEEEI